MIEELQRIAIDLGLPVDDVVRQEALIYAGIVIAIAIAAGWAVQRWVGPPLKAFLSARDANAFQHIATLAPRLIGTLTTVILLVAASAFQVYGFFGRAMVALALGIALGRLLYVCARMIRLNTLFAFILGAFAAVASIAGSLGGLEPLVAALDGAAIRLGSRRVSLLDFINAVIVVVALYASAKFFIQLLSGRIGNSRRLDLSQRVLFQKLSGLAVIAGAFFLGIELLGIDLTALAFFSGGLGIAVGFGMQKTFGNLISGMILLMDRSIKPGDVIVVDDTFGWVNKIGVRAVSIITRDGIEYLIPNEILMTEQVENWSYSSRNVRIHIPVGVSYSCDVSKAQELMLQAAKETPRVLETPQPNVWMTGYGDSSVDHDILCWIADAEEGVGNVKSAILNRLWDLFQEHDIEIPFPQRDLHLRSVPEGGIFDADGKRREAAD
ncbi:MAG: mechanosensitive ion channel domain-containing protein [Pacificimonas sp.]